MLKKKVIFLTKHEIQSHSTRQSWAEGLILQLPKDHDGRNSWLLNYGIREEAKAFRSKRGMSADLLPRTNAAPTISSHGK